MSEHGMHDLPLSILNPQWVGSDAGRVGFLFQCPTCRPKLDGSTHPIFCAIDSGWAAVHEMPCWSARGTTWESLTVEPDVQATSHKCAFAGRIRAGRVAF